MRFSLYYASKSRQFNSVIAVSPSSWYRGILNYFKKRPLSDTIKSIYISLGNEEAEHRHPRIARVDARTHSLKQLFEAQGKKVYFSGDEGDHFTKLHQRTAAGIRWTEQFFSDNNKS